MASAVVAKSPDSSRRLSSALTSFSRLINIITKVKDVVMLILSGSIAISIKVTVGYKPISTQLSHFT